MVKCNSPIKLFNNKKFKFYHYYYYGTISIKLMYYYDYLFIMEIIEYSKSIVNVYFLPLT